jgi:hypothetical protein
VLHEYDMAGMIMKRTDLSQSFNNIKVLARLDTGPNYLVTPIGRGHLE